MRAANALVGSTTGLAANKRPLRANESVKSPLIFASQELPPAGVRPPGSSRPELGMHQRTSNINRSAGSDSAALLLLSHPQAKPNSSSLSSQPRVRAGRSGQSNSASSLSGPPQERSEDAIPSPPSSWPSCRAQQNMCGQDKNPTRRVVHPDPGSQVAPLRQASTPCRSESAFPPLEQIGNKPNDRRRQKSQQRRGAARPGRIMQSIEHPGMEVSLSPFTPPVHSGHPRPYRPATPGPSSPSRAAPAHPHSSPDLFVTSHSPIHTRPFDFSSTRSAVSLGKRPRDEAEELDSAVRKVEWERMLERMRNYEVQMEETRVRLEQASKMVEEQRRRIDDLEQQRRIDDLVKELERQVPMEGQKEHVERNLQPREAAGSQQIQESVQPERRAEQRRHKKHREHIRTAEPDQAEPHQQPEPDTRSHANHPHGDRRHPNKHRRRSIGSPNPAERHGPESAAGAQHIVEDNQGLDLATLESRKATQRHFKREVLRHALSGHNPQLIFDDDDRPVVSEATVFLLRLSQQEVLGKFRRHVRHKEFFDVGHPGFRATGCWIIAGDSKGDYKMKLWDQGERHTFSFIRLAIRLWHNEESIYRLLQGKTQQKAIPVCHNEACMHPGHIQVEPSKEAAERRVCKKRGRCNGHVTTHKDGTVQRRKWCIFPDQPL